MDVWLTYACYSVFVAAVYLNCIYFNSLFQLITYLVDTSLEGALKRLDLVEQIKLIFGFRLGFSSWVNLDLIRAMLNLILVKN